MCKESDSPTHADLLAAYEALLAWGEARAVEQRRKHDQSTARDWRKACMDTDAARHRAQDLADSLAARAGERKATDG